METNGNGGALARLLITLLFLVTCHSDGSAGEKAKHTDANGTKLFTHEKPQGSEKPDSRAWKEIVGREVVIQGLFWGAFEKGYGPYVVMNGSLIYVDSTKLPAATMQGKLVEFKGKLVVRYQPAARKNSAGSSRPLRIFKIQPTEYRVLKRVDWPWMRLDVGAK